MQRFTRWRSDHLWWMMVALQFLPAQLSAQVTWRRTYGGFGVDEGSSVRAVGTEGFVVAGSTGSFGSGSSDAYLIRLDPDGGLLWSQVYGGPGVDRGITCRVNGTGFLLGGITATGDHGGYDMTLYSLDQSGEIQWSRTFGTEAWDLLGGMELAEQGALLAGTTFGDLGGVPHGYIVRVNSSGDTLWTRTFPDESGSAFNGVTQGPSGSWLVAGQVTTIDGDEDELLVSYNDFGELLWTSVLGGDSTDRFFSVCFDGVDRIVACGSTIPNDGLKNIHLVGFNTSGSADWERLIGNTADAEGAEIRSALNGGFVLTGYNSLNAGEKDMILTRVDQEGLFLAGNNFGNGQPADGLSVDVLDGGGYVVAGWCEGYGPGPRAVYVVRTDDDLQTQSNEVDPLFDPVSIPESPVRKAVIWPTLLDPDGVVYVDGDLADPPVRMTLLDAAGRVVRTGALQGAQIALNGTPPGPYLLELGLRSGRLLRQRIVVQ